MNIALIQCPGWGRDCPSYTQALFSAILKEDGHRVHCFDLNNALYWSSSLEHRKVWDDKDLYTFWSEPEFLNKFLEDNEKMLEFQIESILNSDSRLIFFTVHFTSLFVSLELARRIKEKDNSRFIAFGGPDCSLQQKGEYIINQHGVDAVCTGEGDLTIKSLAQKLSQKASLNFCKGLLLKKKGKIINGGNSEFVSNINSLPFPDYSSFRADMEASLYNDRERLEIFDSRSCNIRCHFCSEWQFWGKFRSMRGKRIYAEIVYQLKQFPFVRHFYFIGSLLNGNVKALEEFCDLVIKNNLNIEWSGQAVIRPEMNRRLLEKMCQAGCTWLGYGVESGSQKIVDAMNKRFSLNEAERVLKDTRRAGIEVQANFMFGIPGEEEDDFKKTLNFLERNRKNINSVLASQSFCVIDKGTYLYRHPKEFKINEKEHHLYWEADGGKNNYAERFKRYEKFCEVGLSLGLPETAGLLRQKPDKWLLLGDYCLYKNDYAQALRYFRQALEEGFQKEQIIKKINQCRLALGENVFKSIENCNDDFQGFLPDTFDCRLGSKQKKMIKILSQMGLKVKAENYKLVETEKLKRQEFLKGFPYWLTIDPTNFCNLKCPFCPTGQRRPSRTKGFLSLDSFKSIIEELGPYLIHIDFCNWGEPLLNKQIYQMIKIAKQYHIDTKTDSNLSQLTEKDAENLVSSGLDKLTVSIDGATPESYSKYRVGGDFKKTIANLKLLLAKRKQLGSSNPHIVWQFLVFRHNEHEIKKVKKIAASIGVDDICITKAFIGNKEWMPKNKEYSNYDIEKIKKAGRASIDKTSSYFNLPKDGHACNWPWEAVAVNPNGSVSPCCATEDEKDDFGNILQSNFREVWNNFKYRQARKYIRGVKTDNASKGNICFGCQQAGLINLDLLSCRTISDAYHSLLAKEKLSLKERTQKIVIDNSQDIFRENRQLSILEREKEKNKESFNKIYNYKDIKVALILAPGWGRGSPPYMLALLSGVLRQKGYRVCPFDINNSLYHFSKEKDKLLWNWEESFFWQRKESVEKYICENNKLIDGLVNEIIDSGVKVVGFSVYSTTKLMSLELAKRIKTKKKNIHIIFGGTECQRRLNWQYLIRQECVDILVFDEADQILPEIIELVAQGKNLANLEGIAYKKKGKVIDCRERSPLKNLDSLPFADFSNFDFFQYRDQNPHVLQISTSRGCSEQCVYCSTRAAVKKFRTMSGERIFKEIEYQVKTYKKKMGQNSPVFVFFLDLLINADLKALQEWTAKLAEARKTDKDLSGLRWYGQIILRKSMSKVLLKNIKDSGCNMLNYGVESGCEKVLKDMRKRLNPQEAERVVREIYEAGIPSRGNFMFGFPTETEDDFEQTLTFLKRNGQYMKEIYPSRTFCALERFSYLESHRQEFGVSAPKNEGENLFWESQAGKNNYLVRLKRYEKFCELADSFPHKPLLTGVENIKRDNWLYLGQYYKFKKEYKKTIDSYQKYLSMGGTDKSVLEDISLCREKLSQKFKVNTYFLSGDKQNINNMIKDEKKNLLLNQKEYKAKKKVLASTPPHIYFQIDGPCNQDCIFCSRPDSYDFFSLQKYRFELEEKLYPIFSNAETIYLTGAGELLLLPEKKAILEYFNRNFPYVKKMFATNGSGLTPEISHLISESKSKFMIHISLHASNAQLHKKLTKSNNFEKIIENIRYLSELGNKRNNTEIHLMFLATSVNIKDLPDFVRLAAQLKAGRVYCDYVSIYKPVQEKLSCYFEKDLTNAVFDEAEAIAGKLNVKLDLPWRFNRKSYPELGCDIPWTQMMINLKGEVLPCCLFGDFRENFSQKSFWEIWNGKTYQALRSCLLNESEGFCKFCLRKKPGTVNDFRAHIIRRGKVQSIK